MCRHRVSLTRKIITRLLRLASLPWIPETWLAWRLARIVKHRGNRSEPATFASTSTTTWLRAGRTCSREKPAANAAKQREKLDWLWCGLPLPCCAVNSSGLQRVCATPLHPHTGMVCLSNSQAVCLFKNQLETCLTENRMPPMRLARL
jgi:hypothetical protein